MKAFALLCAALVFALASFASAADTPAPAKSAAETPAAKSSDTPAAAKEGATKQPAAKPAANVANPAGHTVYFDPKDVVWADAPPAMPKGSKMMVLTGDPKRPGPFTMRIMLPAGYKVLPHWHSGVENVTVLSGMFHHAAGTTWDETKGHAMGPGAFISMPAGMRHYAWASEETVIQVHGIGPWSITYVNAADDPRQAKQAAK